MDKNGKIFGKISIIDLLVVLAIIVGAVGFSIRFFSDAAENVTQKVKFEYVVQIENVRHFTVDALNKKGIVTDDKSGAIMGEITNVESEPYKVQLAMTNGKVVSAAEPEKYIVNVTVVSEGNETEGGYFVGEDVELAVGSTVEMCSKYANSSGKIKSIKIISE